MKENGKKEKIIEIGFDLFNKFGYNGTSINEIIRIAEIPKGSFYHYFESKEAFMIEVMQNYSEGVCNYINKYLGDKSIAPDSRIRKMYSDFIVSYETSGKFPYGSFASKINSEVGDKYLKIRIASNEVYSRIIESHSICLEESKLDSGVCREMSINELAEMIIYCWEGAILRMQSTNKIAPLYLFQKILDNIILI